MGKPKIYVPGQKNDFLDWARKMNLNASLDMKGGGVQSAGGAMQSAPSVPQGMPQGTAGVQSAVSGVNTPVANSQTPAKAAEGTVGRAFEHAQGK